MLSLGAVKDGVILPSEEDRKRILTQMKVRTTLKGDNSWIQQRSDGEKEQHRSPLHSPVRSRGTNGRSPVSPRKFSPIRRTTSVESPTQNELQPSSPKGSPRKSPPSATQPPGYLIRGVFTKTIDKTGPLNTASNGSPKSAKVASLPRTSPGYKLSTEEYKKLAPYNVKRESAEPYEANRTVSLDEQKKRTEAASSVLRRTAGKERSYVFSAAKKSSGSPSQDTPSFVAQRVDLEDDTGPRSRSQTVPASGWFGSRVKSIVNGEKRSISESPWGEPRMTNAASTTSIDTGSRSQAPKPSSESSPTSNRFSSLESSYGRPGDQKSELPSYSDHAPKVLSSPTKSSENRGKVSLAQGTEKRGVVFSEDSYKAKPKSVMEMPPSPRITISAASSPKRPSDYYRISDAGIGVETHHQPQVGEYMNDRGADVPRSALDQKEGNSFSNIKYGSPNSRVPEFSEHQPVTARDNRDSMNAISGERYGAPIRLSADEDVGPSRSFSGSERKTTQEAGYESQSDTEYKKVEAHLAKTGSWSSESSLGISGTQSELFQTSRRDEPELDTTRSSSFSTESGMATPESRQGEYGSDSDSASRSYFPFRDNNPTASPRSHRVPFYKDSCEPEVGSRGLLFVKESVNSTELSSSPRYNSRSMVDLSDLERSTYSSATSLNSVPPKRSFEDICTYCGREIRNCAKITIENLKICCHEYCFRCGICHKPMGDLLDKIFIHRDIVHCDKCYEKLF